MEILQLTFHCSATTDLALGGWQAGNWLRGALGQSMLRMTCATVARTETPSASHVETCPACRILAQESAGGKYRAYAIVPPLNMQQKVLPPGTPFAVGIRLYGSGIDFLPYFVTAFHEVGQQGLGPQRGQFRLDSITADNPFTAERELVLAPNDTVVHSPTNMTVFADSMQVTEQWLATLQTTKSTLMRVSFLTPTRLTVAGKLAKLPDFGVLAGRLLDRIEGVHAQWGDTKVAVSIAELRQYADRVRILEWDGHWQEVTSHSSRTRRKTYISGFVGQALYQSYDWDKLLPWLVWGEAFQVGKDVVKGNGVYQVKLEK